MDVKVLGATCDGSSVIGVLRLWFSMFSWQSLHKGTLFKGKNDTKFVMKKLNLVTSTKHCSTDSGLKGSIPTDTRTIMPANGDHHVMSAAGNPGGDSFCLRHLLHFH